MRTLTRCDTTERRHGVRATKPVGQCWRHEQPVTAGPRREVRIQVGRRASESRRVDSRKSWRRMGSKFCSTAKLALDTTELLHAAHDKPRRRLWPQLLWTVWLVRLVKSVM